VYFPPIVKIRLGVHRRECANGGGAFIDGDWVHFIIIGGGVAAAGG